MTLAIQALVSLAVLAVPAMGPAAAQELGVSGALLGAYIGLVYLGAMLASLGAAPLVLRYGACARASARCCCVPPGWRCRQPGPHCLHR